MSTGGNGSGVWGGEGAGELFHPVRTGSYEASWHTGIDSPRREPLFDQRERADDGPFAEGHPWQNDTVGSHHAVPAEVDAASL